MFKYQPQITTAALAVLITTSQLAQADYSMGFISSYGNQKSSLISADMLMGMSQSRLGEDKLVGGLRGLYHFDPKDRGWELSAGIGYRSLLAKQTVIIGDMILDYNKSRHANIKHSSLLLGASMIRSLYGLQLHTYQTLSQEKDVFKFDKKDPSNRRLIVTEGAHSYTEVSANGYLMGRALHVGLGAGLSSDISWPFAKIQYNHALSQDGQSQQWLDVHARYDYFNTHKNSGNRFYLGLGYHRRVSPYAVNSLDSHLMQPMDNQYRDPDVGKRTTAANIVKRKLPKKAGVNAVSSLELKDHDVGSIAASLVAIHATGGQLKRHKIEDIIAVAIAPKAFEEKEAALFPEELGSLDNSSFRKGLKLRRMNAYGRNPTREPIHLQITQRGPLIINPTDDSTGTRDFRISDGSRAIVSGDNAAGLIVIHISSSTVSIMSIKNRSVLDGIGMVSDLASGIDVKSASVGEIKARLNQLIR